MSLELEKIADFLEPHWRGAGIKPTADWATSEIKSVVEAGEHEREALLADLITLGAERDALKLAYDMGQAFSRGEIALTQEHQAAALRAEAERDSLRDAISQAINLISALKEQKARLVLEQALTKSFSAALSARSLEVG